MLEAAPSVLTCGTNWTEGRRAGSAPSGTRVGLRQAGTKEVLSAVWVGEMLRSGRACCERGDGGAGLDRGEGDDAMLAVF